MPADVWGELKDAMADLAAVPDFDEPLSLEEYVDAFRAEWRLRWGAEPGKGLVDMKRLAERLQRENEARGIGPRAPRPSLTLIRGGRDDA